MKILALDLSKRSAGWAFYEEGAGQAHHGVWDRLGSEHTGRGQLYYKLFEQLTGHRKVFGFDRIYAEEPVNLIPNSVATTAENIWISVGMGAALELFAYNFGLKLVWVHQARWRRHFLGRMPRGTKSVDLKEYAKERCRQLGLKPLRHDDAEALGVLDYACDLERLSPPWSAQVVLRPMAGAVG
jgi:hypothetical protein